MRAKTVNENINFERGIDPKRSMDIGARRNALVLNKIVFDAWDGNNLDGGFVKKRYMTEATHKYLQKLADGDFSGPGGVYKHPTRVWYHFDNEEGPKDWKFISGRGIRYGEEFYMIPKELANVEWERRNI